MHIIVIYDVHKSRCEKIRKYLARWLEHRQRSVFTGFLSKTQLEEVVEGLDSRIVPDYDSLIIYSARYDSGLRETKFGETESILPDDGIVV